MVSLAPQVETVYQTVYETVYENEPVTVMETRYRTAYQTENYTVMRPVLGDLVRRPQVHGDEAGVSDREPRAAATPCRSPVYQTERRERRYTVTSPSTRPCNTERRYTVMKPVVKTQQMERRYTVQRARLPDRTPRAALHRHAARSTRPNAASGATLCMRPVYQTVNQERRYTVMKPVTETVMVEQPYTVCRPVTTVRQETVECGYYERQYTTIPGPVVERRVRVPVQECDLCEDQPRGLLGLPAPQEEGDRDRGRAVPAADGQPARLRLPARDSRGQRDPLCPRDDGPPGARHPVPLRGRGTRRVDCPSPPAGM